MAAPMKLKYTKEQFQRLLAEFQEAIDAGKYTEKIPYETWRKLKRLEGPIKVDYTSPFVRISVDVLSVDGSIKEAIVFSVKTYDWGFGRFFYDYVVKKENDRMTLSGGIGLTETLTACEKAMSAATAISAADLACTKGESADGYYWDGSLTGKTAYDNYATTIADTAKIAGKPLSTNTIELNIPSLDHFGYHQIDGTWDSVASKSEMEDRFNKLEAELQKKVDKSEMKNMKKENDTMMKGINFDFGPCGNTVRLSMYGMAIQNISGEWVSYNPESREIINVDVFNMADGGKYMYKMPVAIADVAVGDIVIHNRVPMFVTAINENGTFEVTDVRAGEAKTVIPTRNMFGFNFMTKVVSMFGAFADAPSADQPFGNMLPFLMMGDENSKDIDPMMMFMMMNQGGNNGAMNAMMLHFMTKDNNEMDPGLKWMFMSMAMGAVPGFMTGNYPKATVNTNPQI